MKFHYLLHTVPIASVSVRFSLQSLPFSILVSFYIFQGVPGPGKYNLPSQFHIQDFPEEPLSNPPPPFGCSQAVRDFYFFSNIIHVRSTCMFMPSFKFSSDLCQDSLTLPPQPSTATPELHLRV